MTFITGLDELGALVEEANAKRTEKVKTVWFTTVIDDGKSVNVRFVNELTEDSPHFDESRGKALAVYEHSDPDNYKSKAVCTKDDEGRCYGCEQSEKGIKGWYRKPRFYINVLVEDGEQEPFVATWSMSIKRNPTFDTVFEYGKETGSLSNLTWRVKRNGVGTDTTFALIPKAPDAVPFDWDGIEIHPLSSVLYEVPYERQAAWFNKTGTDESKPVVEEKIPW